MATFDHDVNLTHLIFLPNSVEYFGNACDNSSKQNSLPFKSLVAKLTLLGFFYSDLTLSFRVFFKLLKTCDQYNFFVGLHLHHVLLKKNNSERKTYT